MKKKFFISLFSIVLLLSFFKINGLCDGETGFYKSEELEINDAPDSKNAKDGEVKAGETKWFYFEAPDAGTTEDQWLILRVIGHSEKGNLYFEVMDEHLNVVKGGYTLTGDHMAETVCRLDTTIEGTTGVYMPRLVRKKTYYVKISGVGKYTVGLHTYKDDYSGEFIGATALVVGQTFEGAIERDDDIDSFCFQVPDGASYKVKVYATKKMNARITDASNYTINTNNLRVLRDRGTAEFVFSGYGAIRYFFLYGNGGTHYNITVEVSENPAELGLWTRVSADAGNNFVYVETKKGAKVTIILKAGKKNGKLYFKKTKKAKKKKTKKSTTQKQTSKKYKLSRKLKSGDVIIVTATKKRYEEFIFKRKIP